MFDDLEVCDRMRIRSFPFQVELERAIQIPTPSHTRTLLFVYRSLLVRLDDSERAVREIGEELLNLRSEVAEMRSNRGEL